MIPALIIAGRKPAARDQSVSMLANKLPIPDDRLIMHTDL